MGEFKDRFGLGWMKPQHRPTVEKCVKYHLPSGDLIIASEACGGVVETNMRTGKNTYVAATLGDYIVRLTGVIEVCPVS
jgi:hypothetical protein